MTISSARTGVVLAAELVIVALVLTTALFGGQLVYEPGIAVAAHVSG